MANYVGSARSNYFRVRDAEVFLDWVETLPGVVASREGEDRFVLLVEDGDDGGWPNSRYDDEGEDEEIDLYAELAGHLAEGEVSVFQEVGAEKLRYLVGYAVAVNHRGEKLSVSIDDVYEKVREAGWGPTPPPQLISDPDERGTAEVTERAVRVDAVRRDRRGGRP